MGWVVRQSETIADTVLSYLENTRTGGKDDYRNEKRHLNDAVFRIANLASYASLEVLNRCIPTRPTAIKKMLAGTGTLLSNGGRTGITATKEASLT